MAEPTPDPEQHPPQAPPPAAADDGGKKKKKKPEPTTFWGKVWHEWVKPLGLVILVVLAVRSTFLDWNDVPSGSMRPTILEGDRIVVNKLAYGINAPFNGPKIDIPFTGISFDNPLDFLPRYLWAAPERGDIVTFWNPLEGIRMVKRVVGVPGDTIRVVNGRLEITDNRGHAVQIDYEVNPDPPYEAEYVVVNGRRQLEAVEHYIQRFNDVTNFVQFFKRFGNYRSTTPVTLADPEGLANDEYWMVGDNRDNSKDSRAYEEAGVRVLGKHITGKAKFIAVSFDGSWFKPAFGRWFRSFDGEAEKAAE